MAFNAAAAEYPDFSDSDDDEGEQQGDGLFRDPEAAERAHVMMEAMKNEYQREYEPQMNEFITAVQNRKQGKGNNIEGEEEDDNDVVRDSPAAVGPFTDDSEISDLDADLEHQQEFYKQQIQRSATTSNQRTPDNYPPGEGFNDEIRGYDPKVDAAGPWTFNRICIVSCIVLVAIVISVVWILLVVVMAEETQDPDLFKYIEAPPLDLNEKCAPDSLRSPRGITDCRTPCNKAQCCWTTEGEVNPVGGRPECLVRQPIKCSPYQVCHNLLKMEHNSEPAKVTAAPIPTPPDTISTCSTKAVLDDVGALLLCEDACNRAPCCWKEFGSGSNENDWVKSCSTDAACMAYADCDILKQKTTTTNNNAQEDVIPAAPSDLAEQCQPADTNKDTMESVETCVEYCSRARCCWEVTAQETMVNGALKLTRVPPQCADRSECSAYQPCTALQQPVSNAAPITTTTTTTTPAASPTTTSNTEAKDYDMDTIYDACYNHDLTGVNGKSLCAVVCERGSCCYDNDVATTNGECSIDDCGKYEPCHRLASSASSESNAALIAQVQAACSDATDLADCVGVCSQATCCFTTDLSKTCEITSPGTVCEDYKPCEVLYASEIAANNGGRRRD